MKKHDVFISYSRKDLAEVKGLVESLKRAIPDLTYWFDLTGIESGDDFQDRIISAIDNSKYVIFALSENSIQSTWTKDEVMYAKNTGKKIIPVLLKGAQLKGWFLFKFGRIDCIDITDRAQMDKMVQNLYNWTNRNLVGDDDGSEVEKTKRSRLVAIWAFVRRYWRRILAWTIGVGTVLFACFVLMLWWFLNSDYYNDDIKALNKAYIADIQQRGDNTVEDLDKIVPIIKSELSQSGMVFVKGGTFTMGATSEQGSDAESDEKPAHSVTVSDFYISKYEVTQAQWKAIMGTTVRQQRDKANPSWPLRGEGDNYPIYYVSWEEVQEFIMKLNLKTARQYRLPTEAEWEYAARGGAKSGDYKYSGSNDISAVAWYEGNSDSKTHPVGQKQPNELGLYDMSGNVYEWCQDWYNYSSYSRASQTTGTRRVMRGGCWYRDAGYCRVSYRRNGTPSNGYDNVGFRLVLDSSIMSAASGSTNRTHYKVGDYYNADGKKGVVFEVTSDGRHGKIISLNETRSNWNDAKSWCARFGSGWYLPTKEELLTIYRVQSTLNSTLAANGDKLKNSCYWSSNEYNSGCACRVYVYIGSTYHDDKNRSNYVRAVSAF